MLSKYGTKRKPDHPNRLRTGFSGAQPNARRVSAASMPGTTPLPSFGFPVFGGTLIVLMMMEPQWFIRLSAVVSGYKFLIPNLTAWSLRRKDLFRCS